MLAFVTACFTLAAAETLVGVAPQLAALLEHAKREPEAVARELGSLRFGASKANAIVPEHYATTAGAAAANATRPVVLAHGMGDSCFNGGMKSVTALVGDRLGVYAVCVPTADSLIKDVLASFLMNMDASVDEFAKRVRADPKLAGGFNALGLSQGNNLIRGYIAKYNDPPVHAFVSVCGINGGVAAFPMCIPAMPIVGHACAALTEVLGALAYNPLVQSVLFQAGYFRDPTKLGTAAYKENSQLAQWNGEGVANLTAAKAKYARTSRFVWVRGTLDTVVWPNTAEQWGALGPGYPTNLTVLPMEQAAWFVDDPFGLRAAQSAGKNAFESFAGEHIRFSTAELERWIDDYFRD